nr:transposase [Oceanirhabdus seepicola]
MKELLFIGNQFKNVKNYVYSRYSGINSIPLLSKPREIRDEWVKSSFANQWKLPARYWKLALSEAISNIKAEWSNIKRRIKEQCKANYNLAKIDKHYINYILKSNELYHRILTHEEYDIPSKFKDVDLNFKYLNNLIRRYTRKYKGKIPYSYKSTTFSVDIGLYSYRDDGINITCTKKGKRLPIKLTDSKKYDRTLIIKVVENRIEVHIPLNIRAKYHKDYENIIGIDKGYKYLFAVSSGKFYGENLNDYLGKETERLNEINGKRNRFYALYNRHLEQGNVKKANSILQNNLGRVKYDHNKLKHNETVKSYINHSLNKLIDKEKPKEIVMEHLDFVNWSGKYPESVKRKLSRWIKGYIRERLEYKCNYNNIKYTYINPAYTSKVCNKCSSFGIRKGDIFTCPKCGEIHADINASVNILDRKDDKEISLYTNYRIAKKILEGRAI